MKRYVVYYQEKAGQGKERQYTDVGVHLTKYGGEVLQSLNDLTAAIFHADVYEATLLLAWGCYTTQDEDALKLLQASGVQFECADMPGVTEKDLDALMEDVRPASAAQVNRKGKPRPPPADKARETAEAFRPVLTQLQKDGYTKPSAMATALMAAGVKTPRGKSSWQASQVTRLLKLLEMK